MLYLVLFNKIW